MNPRNPTDGGAERRALDRLLRDIERFDEFTGPMPDSYVPESRYEDLTDDERCANILKAFEPLAEITERCRSIAIRCTQRDCPGFLEWHPASDNGMTGRDYRIEPPAMVCDCCGHTIPDDDWRERMKARRRGLPHQPNDD